MSDIAIRVENLGKQYRIGALQKAGGRHTYKSLRDSIADATSLPLRAARRLVGKGEPAGNGHDETFWALKDVSFDIKHGEIVGVIGRNGAGKSTLLKLLSRITEPTTGRVEIHGRVGSLLEVGTGFHPELSGRDNVYMNGAILGMKRTEIARQFDEIVAFAEVEKFIDTPVKHYSSGMYLRLAFAVAAHLQTEILIVDEVLAVGDAEFQKKCIGKMQDVSKGGRTVVFVSHNMNAIRRLCTRAFLVQAGRFVQEGLVSDCLDTYMRSDTAGDGGRADLTPLVGVSRRGSGSARFDFAEMLSIEGNVTSSLIFGQPIRVRLAVRVHHDLTSISFGFSFVAQDGTELQGTTAHDGGIPRSLNRGHYVFECEVSPQCLTPGRYSLRAAIFSPVELLDHVEEFLPFEIAPYGMQDEKLPSGHYVGYFYHHYEWSTINFD